MRSTETRSTRRYTRDSLPKATGPVIPTSWGYESHVTVYTYDPVRSKQLLAAAGHGAGLKFTLTFPNMQEFEQMGTILKEQLAAVGIAVDLNQQEYTVLVSQVIKGQMGDILLGIGWLQMDPEEHKRHGHQNKTNQPPNGYNFVHYANPQVDKVVYGGESTLATSQRKSALSQVEKNLGRRSPLRLSL